MTASNRAGRHQSSPNWSEAPKTCVWYPAQVAPAGHSDQWKPPQRGPANSLGQVSRLPLPPEDQRSSWLKGTL